MEPVNVFDFLNQNGYVMKLLNLFIGVYFITFFSACISNVENNISEPKVTDNKPKADSLAYLYSIKDFKTVLRQNFNLQADSSTHYALKNSNFSFFEGFTLLNSDSKNNLKIQFFGFNSTMVCEKAHQRFLNNLGDLEKIKPGKKMKHIKSPPTYMIQNERNLILLKYHCENNLAQQEIDNLKMLLKDAFANANSTILDIECGGPVNWLQ